ncbi:MAG: DUF2851 family protein [Tidjanibacter sp.]|nr:DUF2851 family protein [Tidjanibacter sp.]
MVIPTQKYLPDWHLCAARLADAESVRRVKLLEELLTLRLERKCAEVVAIFHAEQNDWNQTLHIMLLRSMGGGRNTMQLERLARLATARICMREASSVEKIEALLLGASGLLEREFFDDYILRLKEEFDFLARKYSLRPMMAGEWDRCRTFPMGNPVMRLAQAAALVASPAVRFDNIIRCSTVGDLRRTFDVSASTYWTEHLLPDSASRSGSGRMGNDRIDSIGINLVVPLMFAASVIDGGEALKIRALNLLETIGAERNSKIARWQSAGVVPQNAFDSQALLEQSRYCSDGVCGECLLAKQLKITTFTD